jgi:hypothetical protein
MLLYVVKPTAIYDHKKQEFRQFGMSKGKTLLPIYVVAILMAIILYVFFYYLSDTRSDDKRRHHSIRTIDESNNSECDRIKIMRKKSTGDPFVQMQLQQQMQQLQNQMNQLMINQIYKNMTDQNNAGDILRQREIIPNPMNM